jgi:hypothetical protein
MKKQKTDLEMRLQSIKIQNQRIKEATKAIDHDIKAINTMITIADLGGLFNWGKNIRVIKHILKQ